MQSMNKMTCLIAALLLSISISQAQQSRVYSQFFMNPFVYNPAYAGVEGHSVFFGMYRKQWSNIDGAPALSHINFHTPLKGGLGIGFTAYNDQEGLINTTAIKGSLSYLLAIDRKHYLRVGMSLGGGTKSINTEGFDSPSDPAFAALSETATFSLADFGATYHFGHFNVGIALPNLVGYELVGTESFSRIKVDPLGEALFKANYRGHINDDIAFEPHLLYRYNQNLPNQFEAAVITHLKHIVWVGASYRQDAGIIALFGTKIKEKIGVGFAYDIGNSNFNDILGPTFEIHIGYHLGTKKDHAEHVSSFIKSHRKSLEERQAEAQKEQDALAAQEEARNKDRLAALQDERNNRLNKGKNPDEVKTDDKEENVTNDTKTSSPTETETQKDNSVKQDSLNTKENVSEAAKDKNTNEINTDTKTKAQSITDLIEKQRNAAKNDLNTGGNNSKETTTSEKSGNQNNTTTDQVNKTDKNDSANKAENTNTNTKNTQQSITGKTDETVNTDLNTDNTKTDLIDNSNSGNNNAKTTEKIIKDDITDNTNNDKVTDEVVNDERTIEELSNSDIPKKVKKGNHLLELESGNYVIAGAFQVFDHAETFSDELFENGYRDVIVGYVTETKLYYVVLFQSKSVEKAKRQRTLLKQREGFSKIWLLTVE